ncbi:MAG: hypothetical protein M1606_03375 [Candidatus Thermoplasmatota archaeon]|nr:hypothetical protein [Candidatus Thermoplasmatota archaeon]MCL5983688.1 hypothetical protein [Candidatus Thermoplasmatota archaeon]
MSSANSTSALVPPAPAPETPTWSTGVLWGLLAAFLLPGTAAVGILAYAVAVWIALDHDYFFGAIVAISTGVVAFLCFLFMAGILYRVDRYRGVDHKVVKLFE